MPATATPPEGQPLSRPLRESLLAATFALVALAFGARAVMASWMIPPVPDRPKDFTIVKRNGLYHLFYIRNNPNLPADQTQMDFGHATSEDLYFWRFDDPVLPVRPGLFDQAHVWAPSIVERDGVYYMFYTGVADSPGVHTLDQRIGVATSLDLYTWNRLDLPVLSCADVPWSSCDSLAATPFRDPFVMADPTTPGRWLMYYSTAPASDPGGMIAGVAASDGDFTHWSDLGGLWITQRAWTYNDVIESPHLFEHNGTWYLFFTSNSGQPISWATSANPLAEPIDWTYRGRLGTMLGMNTQGWFASEHFRDGLVDYLCYVNGDRVEISQIQWQGGTNFTLAQPDLFHVRSLNWYAPTVRAGQTATLFIQSKWWSGHSLELECFWVGDDGVWHPVSNSDAGIPDQIPIFSDLATYSWSARTLPPWTGAPSWATIVVRTHDQTATSNTIQVLPQGGGEPGIEPPPPPGDPNGTGVEDLVQCDANPILRRLKLGTLFSSEPALLVNLPEEQPARLDVFDLQGRRVRTLADRRLPAGAVVLSWDGRDEGGRRMTHGLYFARLTTPRLVRTTRILLR